MAQQYLTICGVRYSVAEEDNHLTLLAGNQAVWKSSLTPDQLGGFNKLSVIPADQIESIISRLYIQYKITGESALTDVYATSIVFEINRAYARGNQAK